VKGGVPFDVDSLPTVDGNYHVVDGKLSGVKRGEDPLRRYVVHAWACDERVGVTPKWRPRARET